MPFWQDRRAYAVAAVAAIGGAAFGYDTGIGGGVIALSSFQHSFYGTNLTTPKKAELSSNIVSILFGGAFFGSLFVPVADRLGRKYSLVVATLLFLFGAFLQIGQTSNIDYVYAGRAVAGLGIGMISNLSPIYISETAPKHIRGRLTGLFQMLLVIGGLLAYFITYGCSVHMPTTSTVQWRLPLGFQAVPGFFLLVGLFLIPESPRWLASAGRTEEARATLAYIRAKDIHDSDVVVEFAEIEAQLAEEKAAGEGLTLRELLKPANLKRLAAAYAVSIGLIFCGHTSILYYGPTIFQTVGYDNQNSALLATGIFTVIKVVCTPICLWIGIDRYGRRAGMLWGSAAQAAVLYILGALCYKWPTGGKNPDGPGPQNRAMAAMLYLFVIAYSFSWGPIAWIYISEIFSARTRQIGVATAIALTWLANYAISKSTPLALVDIKAGWWIVLASFNAGLFALVWFLPETRGKSLEEMDILFGSATAEVRENNISAALEHKHKEKEEMNLSKSSMAEV